MTAMKQGGDGLEHHRGVDRPDEVRQRRTPDRSRVHLADEGGDGRRPEKPERDNPRGLSDRLAGDDRCQLGDEDGVDGTIPIVRTTNGASVSASASRIDTGPP